MKLSELNKAAEFYGGICLSHNAVSEYSKVEWRCNKGHRFVNSLFNVNKGIWCQKCAKETEKEMLLQQAIKYATANKGNCLSNKLISKRSPLLLVCANNHKFSLSYDKIDNGNWCKVCTKWAAFEPLLKSAYKFARINKGICTTRQMETKADKLHFVCSENHKFTNTYIAVEQGSWCDKCRVKKAKQHYLSEMISVAKTHGGECLSTQYINNTHKLQFKCKEGHIWKAQPGNVKMGAWCPICGFKSSSDFRKFPLSYYKQLAEKKGGKVIETQKSFDTNWPIIKLKCKEGHHWATDVNNLRDNTWCPECGKVLITLKRRTPFPVYQKIAREKGGRLLSAESDYTNNTSQLIWECNKKHQFTRKASSVATGLWCQTCSKRTFKASFSEINEKASRKGGKMLSSEVDYINAKSVLLWKCENGHTWKAPTTRINSGHWCAQCKRNEKGNSFFNEIKKFIKNKGGECLSKEYKNNSTLLDIRCKNGHQFSANANNIKSGWWCKYCSGKVKLTIDIFQGVAKVRGGKLLTTKYANVDTKMEWQCAKKHKWFSSGYSVRSQETWCPECYLENIAKGKKG